MSKKFGLRGIRRWPRWTIIPLGILLAFVAIGLGLLLEPAADALSPGDVEPTPTLPAINYARTESDGCHDCHVSLPALRASADDPATAEDYLIEPESVMTPHGTLGCVACHGGDGQAGDKETGHQDLIADMSADDPKQCLICHPDLPEEIPGDRLKTPHRVIVDRINHGEPGEVHCSDCHGGVGHGFDPVSGEMSCSMTICLDCHEELNLDVQMADCDACHVGPHDVATSLTCDDCHSSTEVWEEVDTHIHPVELQGKHGELACFDCHQHPDFKGLNNVCTDCHVSGHTDWGDHDCSECHDAGATWDLVAETWDGHVEHWDQYKGTHTQISCAGCHFETYTDLPSDCGYCHTPPTGHDDAKYAKDCVECHQADQEWEEGTPPEG
jgi:hypothetical protein